MVTSLPTGGYYLGKEGGIANAIVGSLMMILAATLLSLIVSLPTALCINFVMRRNGRLARSSRFMFDVLFGIPSIVYGAFGFLLMMWLGVQASLLGGTIAVALLIMPIMVRAIDEVAILVPSDLTEAVFSLGATRYEMLKVVVRQLRPGIVSATLLAVGRGIGDAATVLFTAGYTDSIPVTPNDPAATLPLAIFFQLSSPVEEVQNRAYAAALILTAMILVISFSVRALSGHNRK
jgi:phosphate transport system permease protein